MFSIRETRMVFLAARRPVNSTVGHARLISKPSQMLRNLIALIAGVILSWILSIGGARLGWLLIIGNVDRSENKDAIVSWLLWNSFVTGPAVAVIVAALVASIVRRSRWWLGGVVLLPLCLYGSFVVRTTPEILLSVAYVGLAFGAAFIVSRFKRSHPV